MKRFPLFLASLGVAALGLACAGAGHPRVPLRCEARPYPWTSGLVKVEIRDPAVVIPEPVQAVRPEPADCGKLAELDPDTPCAAPSGPACAFVVHPTARLSGSALPEGRFPVVLFNHGNNAPVRLYEALLKRLAHEGFIVLAPCCPSFARTAGDEVIWIQRLEAALGWLERADAGLLPGDAVASRLAGHVDLERIGVAGHSRGAAESVRLLGLDPRIKAGVVAAPAANNQGQCPQSPLCTEKVVVAGGSGTRPAVPTDALERCCHVEGLFGGADTACAPPSNTVLPPGCSTSFEIWTPMVGGQVFADPVDLIPKVNKPMRVLAAEHDGVAQPFGDDAEGTHGGFKRRPIQTSVPTGCFWQEDGNDSNGDGTAWEYGFCDGSGQRDGAAQVYQANRGPSQFLVVDKGLHCGFNQTFGDPSALCDGPPHSKVLSFEVDPTTGAPRELPHLDPRVQFELFTDAAVEFFKLELGDCESYLWDAWYDVVPRYRQHLKQVELRPAVEVLELDAKEVVLPPGGEQRVRVTVRNGGPEATTIGLSLLAARDASVGPCGAKSLSGWCFEAPAATLLGPGETRPIEIRVAAPGRHPRPLPGARLFVRDNRGHGAASVGLGLRVANAQAKN